MLLPARTAARLRAVAAAAGVVAAVAVAPPAAAITHATQTAAFAAVGRGVQVAPSWVLTAAHNTTAVGATWTNGYGSFTVAARYDAPGAGPYPANDLALLRLVAADAVAAPYLPLYAGTFADGEFDDPLAATIVSAFNTETGPRAYGWTTIGEAATTIDPDDGGPRGDVVVHYLLSHDRDVYVQGNDSGGGLFGGHVADTGVLLGIASAQLRDAGAPPRGSAFVRPAAYRSWIDATLAADPADDESLLWVSAVPEPATGALAAVGAAAVAGVAARRRRRRA